MSEFNSRAHDWDNNPIHWERSEAIAKSLLETVPVNSNMKALEFGAGTGILGFLLSEHFSEITLMDNAEEMVKVMHEKVLKSKSSNIKPLFLDLEHSDYFAGKFDIIFTQMVLHHIQDTENILNKFFMLLNPGGYLAIADLYLEDGSFHVQGFSGHNGFDVTYLQTLLEKIGFEQITSKPCYTIKKPINGILCEFPIFLMIAIRK